MDVCKHGTSWMYLCPSCILERFQTATANDDYDKYTRMAETDPEGYAKIKERIIKSSRFYEAPKEEKPYEYDPDFDDP